MYVFRNVPGPPFRLFSARHHYFSDLEYSLSLSRKYGDVWKIWHGLDVHLIVSDPELLGLVAYNSADYEIPHRPELIHASGYNLLTLLGSKHKKERKILNPSFHSTRLQCMASFVETATTRFLKKLDRYAESGEAIEVTGLFRLLTLEIICQAAFGCDVDCLEQPNQPLAVLLAEGMENRNPKTYFNLAKNILSGRLKRIMKVMKAVRAEVVRFVSLRETLIKNAETPEKREELLSKDILGLMLAKKEAGELTFVQVVDEALGFMFAGHETTATLLSFTLALLDQNPEVQDTLVEELNRVIGDREPSFDVIKQCDYLNYVLQENARINPPIPVLYRVATRDLQLGKYKVLKGTHINISPLLVQNNPTYWENPTVMVPTRFETKNVDNSYLPFSLGPRNCIGQYFANMEAKIVAARSLKEFKFTLVPGQDLTRRNVVSLFAAKGIRMTIQRRK
jgi:cytochrome P450